ncbi:MAG TPA: hypothetical protein VMW91_12095 [Desulfosporosinus sp.]|nr:hypothetical protein [Desulfosporosinus sp.]
MSESEKMTLSHSQVTEALIKYNNIHEGLWGLYVEFGIAASNVGPSPDQINPAAIVPVLKIGLQKFDKPNNMTANAAVVNPPK